MNLGISGRRALITGAAGGIGRATARALIEEDVEVVLTDLKEEGVRDAAAELGAVGHAADLSSADGVAGLHEAVQGDIDILVHAAGVTGAKGDPMTMEDADWDHAWRTDFMSGVRLARAFGPAMLERRWGRMVFVTSENAAQPYPDETVYNVAKIAIASFAKSLAMAHAGNGLSVNCVAPAFVETAMTDGMMDKRAGDGESREEAVAAFLEEERPFLALGRRGRPEEVAAVIALLCSERASFVAGANWRVDGGSVASVEM
jgi:NAD(P)-dependent dehydrogenase (short-subunit alcohol dehydrogenase family)